MTGRRTHVTLGRVREGESRRSVPMFVSRASTAGGMDRSPFVVIWVGGKGGLDGLRNPKKGSVARCVGGGRSVVINVGGLRTEV